MSKYDNMLFCVFIAAIIMQAIALTVVIRQQNRKALDKS